MSSPRKRRGGVEAILGGADKRIEERKERETAEKYTTPDRKTKQKVSYYLNQDAIMTLEEIKITLRKAGLSPREASYSRIIEVAIEQFQGTLDASPVETLSHFGNKDA
ncbi:MAG TPA: hypothetical protein VE288_17110 [Rubrobacteraceae bacterium]|nr:hypothetical protein [Rubrobacteraceae bacterium]